jgi:hypothetical protein
VSRGALYLDLAVAGLVAFLTVILSPGLAVVGLLAVAVLLVCGISFAVDSALREWRRPRKRARRSNPPGNGRRSTRRGPPRDFNDPRW